MRDKAKKKRKEPPQIDIYKAWCKGCGICTAFCPTGALARDEAGYPYVKEPDKCVNCGWCEMHCPDFAITVEQKNGRRIVTGDGADGGTEQAGSETDGVEKEG
jgi:2-oxoglutarate ferredoxin oxidoreductase subunit delta